MQAGILRYRVIIQTTTRTTDGGGGFTESWADTVTVWARVEEMQGLEAFEAMQVASRLAYRITIRKRTVTPQQRIKYGSKILRIKSVATDERAVYMTLLCDEEDI
jgi:SPP1 family predicted phage head-tail adaptor